METQTQRAERETAAKTDTQTCPSCQAALVEGMRFCRACGYRLGEGMAEYVETVRFNGMPNMAGGMMGQGDQSLAGAPTTVMTPAAMAPPAPMWKPKRSKKKLLAYLLMAVVLISLVGVGGAFLIGAIRDAAQQRVVQSQPYSFFGADDFGDAEGNAGALLAQAMPGSPAEQAGLLDGDIITKFDTRPVNGEDSMREALRETPIGKTVEVVYLRDGETKTAMLTTISNENYDSDDFLPKERGMLGIEDTERVAIEGTNIYGMRIGEVYDNRPADLAGIKEGDIIIEFDGKPVRTRQGLYGYINAAKPASTVPIVVYREGQRIVIPVKMGRRN